MGHACSLEVVFLPCCVLLLETTVPSHYLSPTLPPSLLYIINVSFRDSKYKSLSEEITQKLTILGQVFKKKLGGKKEIKT